MPVYTDVYTVDGSKILSEQRTDEETGNVIRTIYYVYDANGQPVGMKYNGVQYWYQKNMQGDVVRILNASGAEVVSYAYDAWGKVLSVSGSLSSTVGAANPFRYRGYYYDTETGWYYLNTRYYLCDLLVPKPENHSVFVDKAVKHNITVTGRAMGKENRVAKMPLGSLFVRTFDSYCSSCYNDDRKSLGG